MDEQDTTQTGDEGVVDDTSDTGADSGVDTGSTQTPPTTQTPPERTFNQQQVNAFIAEERRKWAAANPRATPVAQPQVETPGSRPFDPETQAALEAYLQPIVGPLNEARVAAEIERATSAIKSKHPELADQANMDAVINTVLTWGEDIINRAPMNWLMEQGYNAWKFGSFDEKAYNAKVVADYVASKSKVARETPPPQGGGGRATTSKKGQPKDWKGADAAMKDLIAEAQSNS